ncbi:hypothetical protein PoB_001318400 [Plakobranchus ocellatus]|uniref:Uncharacterized protein n=1 Tax=Plakobranchus ocellatus TaxID=259542 RepID=A0AAV3YY59_9GAST|nr:hypothetical protein PoB_001318400 [Plakobranchus ocellatus]
MRNNTIDFGMTPCVRLEQTGRLHWMCTVQGHVATIQNHRTQPNRWISILGKGEHFHLSGLGEAWGRPGGEADTLYSDLGGPGTLQ